MLTFGLKQSEADYSVFYCHTSSRKCVYLTIYVDDIVITRNDITRIARLEKHLFRYFLTKDLGYLKYFLGIKVAQSIEGATISRRKYALDILEETNLKSGKPTDSPMDSNQNLMRDQGELFLDTEI